MLNHGINTVKSETNILDTAETLVGIPFFVGAWPCHTKGGFVGKPQLVRNLSEAKALGGYSEDWRDASGNPKWTLCEAAYSQFAIFGQSPAIFYNVFDPATHKSAVSPASKSVTDHAIVISDEAIIDSGLTVKSGDDALVKDTDYTVAYDGNDVVIVLKSGSTYYTATALTVGYNKVDLSGITASAIETAIGKIETCKALLGIVPDLIACPGWSQTPVVAAVMAAKAASINGMYKGKAVVDLDTSVSGADTYDDIATYKSANGYTDENMIVCWPLAKNGGKVFNFSTVVCGLIAQTDRNNSGVPSRSISNLEIPVDGCVVKAGTEIALTVEQADVVSYTDGVVTAFNFNGWRAWGNYTGAGRTANTAKAFICTNRMHDFICNSFIDRFWVYLDRPLTRVLIDAIVNEFNAYLTALTASGDLYGGEISYVEANNSDADLLAGKFRLDTVLASPVPAQQIDMVAEFDVGMIVDALNV